MRITLYTVTVGRKYRGAIMLWCGKLVTDKLDENWKTDASLRWQENTYVASPA
jgi:hypothetical protein